MERKQQTQVGDLMTVDAAARAVGMTFHQLDKLVRQGKVNAVKVGNVRLIKLSDVLQVAQ